MASMIDISVLGRDDLMKALNALPKKVARKLATGAMKRGADLVLASAKSKVSRFTGTLADLLTTKPVHRHGKLGYVVIAPAKELLIMSGDTSKTGYYPAHLEFGTKRMPAKPFMRPAADENKEAVFAVIEAALDEVLGE